MAIESRSGYWKDTASGYWYLEEPLAVGDTVECVTNSYATINKGDKLKITSVARDSGSYQTVRINGTYEYMYSQKLSFSGFTRTVSSKNFKKVDPVLAIETNRPTIVQEIAETVNADGKVVVTNVGDPITLESMSAARVFTTEAITTAIREKNTYRQFRIFQEVSVARAKKPEIEFA